MKKKATRRLGRRPLSEASPSREIAVRVTGRMVELVDRRAAEVGLCRSAWVRAVILAVIQHPRRFGEWVVCGKIPEEEGGQKGET